MKDVELPRTFCYTWAWWCEMEYKAEKAYRLLYMSDKLRSGEALKKSNILAELGIPSKTFQRDIDSLRLYFDEKGTGDIVYDRKADCYTNSD